MIAADIAIGRPVRYHGQSAWVIDIDWSRINRLRVRIRIPHADPRTRWVPLDELEAEDG